jgi:hypothetical protein
MASFVMSLRKLFSQGALNALAHNTMPVIHTVRQEGSIQTVHDLNLSGQMPCACDVIIFVRVILIILFG